jgi:cytochrome b561
MKPVVRYHPLLVALHWVLALLIVGALLVGFFGLAEAPDAGPQKIRLLRLHMAGGMLILALTSVRLIVRMGTARPAAAVIGHPLLDRLRPALHHGLYLLVFLLVGTGFATAILSGLNEIVFGSPGKPLPSHLSIYPTFVAHGALAAILAGLVGLHVVAALYHHVVRGDGLFQRMSFGRRVSASGSDRSGSWTRSPV